LLGQREIERALHVLRGADRARQTLEHPALVLGAPLIRHVLRSAGHAERLAERIDGHSPVALDHPDLTAGPHHPVLGPVLAPGGDAALDKALMTQRVDWVLDVDIRTFFDRAW